jgi:hypothetical protein
VLKEEGGTSVMRSNVQCVHNIDQQEMLCRLCVKKKKSKMEEEESGENVFYGQKVYAVVISHFTQILFTCNSKGHI